jgi:hypothetical protein
MRQDSTPVQRPVPIGSGPVAGQPDGAVALPAVVPVVPRLALARVRFGPLAGRLALGTLLAGALAVVAFAATGPSVLVPGSALTFPNWESGPLHGLIGRPVTDPTAIGLAFSAVLLAMLAAWGVALGAVRALSLRTIAICVVALHAILVLSPPLQLTDLFNYIGYARLGALHHINPYRGVIAWELHDPVFAFTSWHNLPSPYGQLFTALTYPLAFLSLPVAYWTLKVVTVLSSLAFVALVWRCALMLGRDPRFAVLFVAANPIYLMYEVAGFHNDFFMLLPMLGAIMLLLGRRDRSAGAAVMVAVAVKFSAALVLPFLLIAARPPRRRIAILTGAVLAAVPLVALSVALFGLAQPNLSDQSTLLTDWSIPNMVGLAIGTGGTPALLRLADVALVACAIFLLRRRRELLVDLGWATLALIASLAWLVPWYVVWLLPLAALGTSVRLRRAAAVATIYLLVTFMPAIAIAISQLHWDPMGTPAGHTSLSLQHRLSQGRVTLPR